jgi:hypothetical protein
MAPTLDTNALHSFLDKLRYPVDHNCLKHEAQMRSVSPSVLQAIRELPHSEFSSREEILEHIKAQGYDIE